MDVKTIVASRPVVVFSKTYCPFCVKAKKAIAPLVDSDSLLVLELENHPQMNEIQDVLAALTGARSVPRVFSTSPIPPDRLA